MRCFEKYNIHTEKSFKFNRRVIVYCIRGYNKKTMDLISLPPCSRHIEKVMHQDPSSLAPPTFHISTHFLATVSKMLINNK